MLSSALSAERRLTALIGHLVADFGHLAPDLTHRTVDLATHRQIVAAPRRQAAQMHQHHAADFIEQRVGVVRLTSDGLMATTVTVGEPRESWMPSATSMRWQGKLATAFNRGLGSRPIRRRQKLGTKITVKGRRLITKTIGKLSVRGGRPGIKTSGMFTGIVS